MKKTEKTALTAAVFAAAMYGTANAAVKPVDASASFASTTTSVVGLASVDEGQPAISPDAIKELNSKMATVYGPPSFWDDYVNEDEDVVTTTTKLTTLYGPPRTTTSSSVEEEEITTSPYEDEEDIITTTREYFVALYAPPEYMTTTKVSDEDIVTTTRMTTQTVYGPPRTTATTTVTTEDIVIAELQTNGQPVYGPAPLYGDVNGNGRTDVFDMILLRERFAENNTNYSFAADVNSDMKISVADLVILQKFLLGKIDDIRYPEREDIVTTTMDDFQDVYGPPPTWTTAVPEDDDPVSSATRTQPVYGAPVTITKAEESEQTTAPDDNEDVVTQVQTTVKPTYGPPPSFN